MSSTPPDLPMNTLSSEEELAAVLDEALDAVQRGQAVDHAALVARYPPLAEALAVLQQLAGEPPTAVDRPRSSLPRPVPERIGPYHIEGELGVGGFGLVYQAYDPDLKLRVALKVLHPERLDQSEAIERFQREACATARLRHPGIVRLYEFSRDGPPYYLVTEFVEGEDLRTWFKRRQPTPAESADLVARIAEAIDHAHGQGVYHRDLKPGNILVDGQGNPHILDFGLARLYREFEESSGAPTSEGRILGTLAYMAPEQAAGHSHQADARSDVYSLGVILYELLTGRLPFLGPVHALPARVMDENPPTPRQLCPQLPRDLEAICLKAMAKQPEGRYASAATLARDLRAFLRGEPVEAEQLTWMVRLHKTLSRRHRDVLWHDWSTLLFLLGVIILAGCALVNLWQVFLPFRQQWGPILLTKAIQVALMLYCVIRFRPLHERELTSAERQIWALVPAYYVGFLALMAVTYIRADPLLLGPVLAIMSGMAFITLGATIWGWLYLWGAAFFALAVFLAASGSPLGMLLVGLGWFLSLVLGSIQLRRIS